MRRMRTFHYNEDTFLKGICAIVIAFVATICLYSSYSKQHYCDVTTLASLKETYPYETRDTSYDDTIVYKTVYGGIYRYEVAGTEYTVKKDTGSYSSSTVPIHLKVAYYSDDPSINVVYTDQFYFILAGIVIVLIALYGAGCFIFRW